MKLFHFLPKRRGKKRSKRLLWFVGLSVCLITINRIGPMELFYFFLLFSTWLWNIARGISGEEVQCRLLPKSHGSGKSFPGPQALRTISSVRFIFLIEKISEIYVPVIWSFFLFFFLCFFP